MFRMTESLRMFYRRHVETTLLPFWQRALDDVHGIRLWRIRCFAGI